MRYFFITRKIQSKINYGTRKLWNFVFCIFFLFRKFPIEYILYTYGIGIILNTVITKPNE